MTWANAFVLLGKYGFHLRVHDNEVFDWPAGVVLFSLRIFKNGPVLAWRGWSFAVHGFDIPSMGRFEYRREVNGAVSGYRIRGPFERYGDVTPT